MKLLKNKKILMSIVAVLIIALFISGAAVSWKLFSPFILSQFNSSDDTFPNEDYWESTYEGNDDYNEYKYLKPGDELKYMLVPHYKNGGIIDIDEEKIECKIEAVKGSVAEGTYYDYKTSTLKISENQEDLSVIKLVVSIVDTKNIKTNIPLETSECFYISKERLSISVDFGEDIKTFYTGQRYDFTMSVKNESGKTFDTELSFMFYSASDDDADIENFENGFIANTPGKYVLDVYSMDITSLSETIEIEVVDKTA